jgi:hypothetical protein
LRVANGGEETAMNEGRDEEGKVSESSSPEHEAARLRGYAEGLERELEGIRDDSARLYSHVRERATSLRLLAVLQIALGILVLRAAEMSTTAQLLVIAVVAFTSIKLLTVAGSLGRGGDGRTVSGSGWCAVRAERRGRQESDEQATGHPRKLRASKKRRKRF